MVPKWGQGGAKSKHNEPRSKKPKVFNDIASFLMKIAKTHWLFMLFFEKSLSRKNAGTLDSTGPIQRPREEVGGGVNPPLRTYMPLNHL